LRARAKRVPNGGPTVLTPEVEAKILGGIRDAGMSLRTACAYARISDDTLWRRRKADAEFAARVEHAREMFKAKMVTLISAAAPKNWNAAGAKGPVHTSELPYLFPIGVAAMSYRVDHGSKVSDEHNVVQLDLADCTVDRRPKLGPGFVELDDQLARFSDDLPCDSGSSTCVDFECVTWARYAGPRLVRVASF
jgi:hypothetical protein